MRLSNKSTFSLASLILLLALGVVFGTTFVMAHAPDDTTVGPHTHPVTEAVAEDTSATPPVLPVPLHNTHPVPVITLRSGQPNVRGNMIALDATTNTTFTLVVDYGMDVTDTATNTDTTGVADDDLSIGDTAHTTLQVDNTAATDAGLAITRVVGDASMFEVVVTPGLYPNADTAATATNDDRLTFRIQLPAGGLFSLQTTEIGTGVDPVTVPGGASLASALSVFTLVDVLPELPPEPPEPDTTAPFFEVITTPAGNTELTAGDQVQFALFASEPLGTGNNELLETDVEGTTNVASMSFIRVSNFQYVVIVTPTDHTKPIVLTIPADAVMDIGPTPNGNAEQTFTFTPADTVAPTVTITSAAGTGTDADKVVFTFTFSEPLAAGSFTSADIDRTQSNVLLAGEPVMSTTDPKVYTLVVTPPATGSATIVLKTGSVMDIQDNVLEGDQSHTYIPPVPPGPATITAPAGGNVGNTTAGATITITFSKDPGTVTAAGVTLDGSGTTRTVKAGTASGSISLTWTGTDAGTSDNGSGTITYTIPAPPVLDPYTSPEITIAAGGFVVVVRSETGAMGSLLTAYDSSINLAAWMDMPDLQNVFDTDAIHGGGALILTQSGDSSVALNPGTVGISEIMWAINESNLGDAVARRAGQWIELHNLNTTAVNVKLSWKTGAKDIAADASINGDLDRPYLDVVTNVFHDRPGNNYDHDNDGGTPNIGHWTLPGSNGNPLTGENFVSAARKGTFDLNSKHDGKFNKRFTRSGKQVNATNSPDGRNKDQWAASATPYARRSTSLGVGLGSVVYEDHGTPGRVNTFTPERADTKVARTNVPFNKVIFSEVANRSNEAYEWIELRNVSDGEINLRNYLISIVESKPAQADRNKPDNDKIFYQFPSNDRAKIAAGGVFLLVASDPRDNPDHPLAVGYNVDIDDEDQVVGSRNNPVHYKVMRKSDQDAYQYEGTGLPDSGDFILILRRPDNPEGHRSGADGGKGVAERGKDDLDKVVDIAGYHPNSDSDNLRMGNYPNIVSSTNTWPLRNFEALDFNRNKFEVDKVHYRANNSSRGSHNDHRAAWQDASYTGIGYKRQAADSAAHGGSPGYHGNTTGLQADNKVIISEIMLSQGDRGDLPQWIELYNPSKTHAVNLADNVGWRLVIENPDRAPIITINFKDDGNVKVIPPNQTVLIVSSSARDYGSDTLPRGTVFPNTRVLNAFTAIRGETFELESRTSPLLNPAGFNLRLMDGKTSNNKTDGRYIGEISDEIGSLDGNPRTNDEPTWEFPSGMTEDGNRTSLVRTFVNGVPQDGMMATSWTRASDTDGFAQLFVRHTWYGDETDYGTPADRTGSILPVSLSFFRPTLENGEVVIRWTTESELDNAGFNILRSESRNGEYKQVNTELIAGHGTTGERHSYKWVDPTAKPGVVYYYQIEDVSFAGERQALALTKLKGLISAKNKLTTRWGELKSQD